MFLSNKRNMMGSLVFLEKPESFKTAVITNRLIITTIFFPSVSFLVFFSFTKTICERVTCVTTIDC